MMKVSIIVPIYNTEAYIKECIDSILRQTYKNIEIILVDDGSLDQCPEICNEYACKDSRIKVLHKVNSGLGYTRNAGLQMVTGDYVTFVDSDDWIDANHIQNLFQGFSNENIDLVIGSHKRYNYSKDITKHQEIYMKGQYYDKDTIKEIAISMIAPKNNDISELGIPMSVCFNLYKVNIIKEFQLSFSSERQYVGEDLFFNLKYILHCKGINFVDSHGYNYRNNPASISRRYDPERFNRTFEYYKLLKKYVKELGIEQETGYRIERSTLSKLRVALSLLCKSDLNIRQKYIEVKAILHSEFVKDILNKYPINTYRLSIRITTMMMKQKAVLCVMIIFFIKNWLRNE